VRLRGLFLGFSLLLAAVPAAKADYVVLRSGQRLDVSSYQLLGDTYRLQLAGGVAEIPASEVVRIEPEEVFSSSVSSAAPEAPAFGNLIHSAAMRYGVDEQLIISVISAESDFNPRAISPRNARGLMQLLPETARRLGVRNAFDPKQNIEAGTRYLRDLLLRYNNDLGLALAAYNAGPQTVERYGHIPPYAETISYVRRIRREYAHRKAAQQGTSAVLRSAL
jgi:soluble lytic murein transglycosylase-like protein